MLTSGNIETNSNTLFYLEVDSHLQFFVFSFFEVFCKFKEINLFQWVIIKIESFELNIKSQSSNNEKTHIILIQFVKLKCSHNSFFPALRKTPNLMSTKTFTRAFKTWKNAFEGYFWAFELSSFLFELSQLIVRSAIYLLNVEVQSFKFPQLSVICMLFPFNPFHFEL